MLKNFTVKNFRGFENLKIDSLGHINLIAGKNNVGKTALLEAIYLLLGASNPNLSLQLNTRRGIETFPLDANEIWGWLFYNKDLNSSIEIKAASQPQFGKEHTLKISFVDSEKTQINPKKMGFINTQQINILNNKILEFNYSNKKGKHFTTRAQITSENKIEVNVSPLPFPISIYVLNNVKDFLVENANKLSELRTMGGHKVIVEALRTIEPELEDLSVELNQNVISIYAYFQNKKAVPIAYMGDGINRLLTILLAITAAKGGCVLIDEIENGFHYSVFHQILKHIGSLSKKLNVQIFATTHSFEFSKMVYNVCQENKFDMKFLRLEKMNGKVEAVSYEKEDLNTSFDLSWEIR